MNRAQRNRAARLARRVLVDGRLVAPLPEERHGQLGTYSNHGCQCGPCVRAGSEYWQEYSGYVRKATAGRQRRQEERPVA